MLSQQHIVKSHRGVKGGFSLGRGPEEISLRDIVEVCEGGIYRPCNAQQPLPEICDGADNDCDGIVPAVSPALEEVPGNGTDNDCDGVVD